jgi:molybdopterin converting factor small subunit
MATSSDSVLVKFFSTVKNITGLDQVEIPCTNDSYILDILQQVQADYFTPKKSRLLKPDNSGLETGIICLLDDCDLGIAGGLKKKVSNSMVITLLSSLHGG